MPTPPPLKAVPRIHPQPRPNQGDIIKATRWGITPEEFLRRDLIVMQEWAKNPYRPGDYTRPLTDEAFKEYGNVHVVGAYQSYHDFRDSDVWPEDDAPMIFTIRSTNKPMGLTLCTQAWLEPKYKKQEALNCKC